MCQQGLLIITPVLLRMCPLMSQYTIELLAIADLGHINHDLTIPVPHTHPVGFGSINQLDPLALAGTELLVSPCHKGCSVRFLNHSVNIIRKLDI